MNKRLFCPKVFIVGALMLIGATSLLAQQARAPRPRTSPHETISQTFDGKRDNRVIVIYGRPYSKDPRSGDVRKIWGGLVPYGKIWRLGADEATLLITQQPLVIGETTIPAGAHTLFMLPAEEGASKLVINKQLGQWGLQYDEKQDLARVDMTKEAGETDVDQLTMALERNPSGGGILKVTWEKTQYSVAFTIKQ